MIADDAPVSEEPTTAQERADLADEREAEQYAEMFTTVQKEREDAGKDNAPIMVAAETMRRLRAKHG